MKLASFKKGHRGFTLIELLVVIAIIGILSSVVLASLNTARNKGADAAIKSNLANARAEAEIYYDSNGNTYAPSSGAALCAETGGSNLIGDNVRGAMTAYGHATTLAIGNRCAANGSTGWAAWTELKGGGSYCVDSTGASRSITTPASAITACP
ncbi:MAG: hypothetical protein QOE22_348 [Candidatus Parcubacteria bacterium]|jgi:prepilin-type N-terminal cleavage/methylation domain-containing protein|nr:hypothetical protein [Candidatus Parcubacteria bacterium]